MRSARSACSAFPLVLLLATPLVAHDLSRSESRCTIQGAAAECELIVDLLAFDGVDDDRNGVVSYAELDRSIASVFTRVKEHFLLRGPSEPSSIVLVGHELIDEHTVRLTLAYTFPADVSALDVTATFEQVSGRPDHQHFVTATKGGEERRAILDISHHTVTLEFGRWTRTAIWLTIAGIGIVGLRVAWFLRARRRPRSS